MPAPGLSAGASIPHKRSMTATAENLSLASPDAALFATRWTPSGPGAGAPVLLLHDSLGCAALWRTFPARLAQATGRVVLAYDRWGFGGSPARADRLRRDFVVEEGARVVPALLDALGWSRVALVGHSVGGGMAVEAAAALGDRCEAIVTIAAQSMLEKETRDGVAAAGRDLDAPGGLDRLKRYHGEKSRWVVDAWTKTWLAPDFADYSLDQALPRITAPLLAIHGERDEYATLAQPARIAQGAPRGRMHVIEGGGHVLHREREEELVAAIAGFLDDPLTPAG